MDPMVVTYLVYLVLSVVLTVVVGQILSRHGQIYLLDVFRGDKRMASAVNQLLVVAFYLVNLGFVALWLRSGGQVNTVREVLETLSAKLGTVFLVIGALHLGNLWIFSRFRRDALIREEYTRVRHAGSAPAVG